MKLSEIKNALQSANSVNFKLPDGSYVPQHFHVTEVGSVIKHFIDCGGIVRNENKVNFQLWEANDFDHRLAPQKLLNIINLSEEKLGIENHEVEVEYQGATIGKYDIGFDGKDFLLLSTQTNCLAQDKCGIPADKLKVNLNESTPLSANSCAPGGNCC
jgi:hypothetical protein